MQFPVDEQDETLTTSDELPKTEQLLGEPDQDPESIELDLAHLRDLLALLRDNEVAAFSGAGFQVSFKDSPPPPPLMGRTRLAAMEDDDRSTSSRQVAGFSADAPKDGWRNPALWPSQAGRTLKLDGSFE